MPYPYQNILLIGATSGIGYALAEKLAEDGKHVVVVGRRQEKLDELVSKYGEERVSSVKFDILDLKGIPGFIEGVLKVNPKIDSVILNSGIQRGIDFTKPDSIDLNSVEDELTTNYTSAIHLLKSILPHLTTLSQKTPTSITFTTSGLALVPLPRCPNYCATKAAMHHLILSLRTQLSSPYPNLKVVELLPPAVQTELHDAKHQPDIVNGGSIGIPLKEFTDKAWEGLCTVDKEQVAVGTAAKPFEEGGWELKRQEDMRAFLAMMRKRFEEK